jgi:hypothetical protein
MKAGRAGQTGCREPAPFPVLGGGMIGLEYPHRARQRRAVGERARPGPEDIF